MMTNSEINQKINQLEEDNKQLRAALEASRLYADKLVEGIPYLPADLRNSREAVLQLTVENDGLRKEFKELSMDFQELTKKYNNLAAVAQKEYAAPPVKHPEVPMLQKLFSGIKNLYEGPSITEAMTESMRNNPIKTVASAEDMMQNAAMASSDDTEDLRLQLKALQRECDSKQKIIRSECEDWAISDTLLEKLGCNMWDYDNYIGLDAGIQQLHDRLIALVQTNASELSRVSADFSEVVALLHRACGLMKVFTDPQEFPGPYKLAAKPGSGKWNLVDAHDTVLATGIEAAHLQTAADCMNALAGVADKVLEFRRVYSAASVVGKTASTLAGSVGQEINTQSTGSVAPQDGTDQPREF